MKSNGILLFALLLLNALWVATRGKPLSVCFDGCGIENRVLECLRLDNSDLPRFATCVKQQNGPLVIDIRKHQLDCTCKFLDFAKMTTTSASRFVLFHSTECSPKTIQKCGMKLDTKPMSKQADPFYALFGGQIFDISASDWMDQLVSMDKQKRRIIQSLKNPLVREKYDAALTILDTVDTGYQEYKPSEENALYTSLEKRFFYFVCFDAAAMILFMFLILSKTQRSTTVISC
ncbi:uncharacterized protein LOC121387730 [Gigantopelta aegis]|uniref:uncharacterized protein LOC121387730 n=1 Tax=Gigantopelta aegis TaxID=1735272 RepID=UPI001B889AA3|nr:uncharacterized protein LOC121387730 [Gigantopelta aegis]